MGAAGTSSADSRPARGVGAGRGGGSLITSDEASWAGGKTRSSPRPPAAGGGVARGAGGVALAFGVARGSGVDFGRGLGGGVERGGGSVIGWRGCSTDSSTGRGRGCGRTGGRAGVAAGTGSIDSRALRKRSRLRCSSAEICAGAMYAARSESPRVMSKAGATRTERS